MKFKISINEKEKDVTLLPQQLEFQVGDTSGQYEFIQQNGRYLLRVGTNLHTIGDVNVDGSTVSFSMNGTWYSVDVKDEQDLLLDRLGFKMSNTAAEGLLKAPMPGKILDIMVQEGDSVEKDQPLVILEAMKMENELKAPVSGTIASIQAEAGQSLEKNALILEIESVG